MTYTQSLTNVTWMCRRHMPDVMAIENRCFEFPWFEDDFVRVLRTNNCIGMVAEYEQKIAGYMVYELHRTKIHVLNFAVDLHYQRQGIGTQLVKKLVSKLSTHRRSRIVLEVRESNLTAQLFFRECVFKAVSVLRNFYADSPEDAYLMQYRYRPTEQKKIAK